MVYPHHQPLSVASSEELSASGSESIPTIYDIRLPTNATAAHIEPSPRTTLPPLFAEQARAILNFCNDAIIVIDPVGLITYCNRTAERMYGWQASSAVGRRINDLIEELPDHLVAERAVELLRVGKWCGVVEQTTQSGQRLWVRTTQTLLTDPRTGANGLLMVNTDVTQLKHLEQQLVRAQRLESLGALAGGIAHDLNNLLTPIRMGVELVEILEAGEERADVLRTLRSGVDRTVDMVRQILAFARGTELADLQVISLAPVVREVHRLLVRTLPKSIRISTHVSEGLWSIRGDATQMHQVIMNLCVNARDAMPNGGTLALTVTNQAERPEGIGDNQHWPGPCVCLAVTDTGTGIAPEVLDRIFDPFFTTKPPGQGTGLGLAAVREITQSHGGLIEVRSELGHGTQFRIYLPAAPQSACDHARPDLARVNGHNQTVLVIDDEPPIRELVRIGLEQAGYRAVLAEDGAEGVALLAQAKDTVAVAVVDLVLPGMNGQTTIRALRRLRPNLPVVIITGADPDPTEIAALDGTVVLKPFTTEQLLAAIVEVLALRESS